MTRWKDSSGSTKGSSTRSGRHRSRPAGRAAAGSARTRPRPSGPAPPCRPGPARTWHRRPGARRRSARRRRGRPAGRGRPPGSSGRPSRWSSHRSSRPGRPRLESPWIVTLDRRAVTVSPPSWHVRRVTCSSRRLTVQWCRDPYARTVRKPRGFASPGRLRCEALGDSRTRMPGRRADRLRPWLGPQARHRISGRARAAADRAAGRRSRAGPLTGPLPHATGRRGPARARPRPDAAGTGAVVHDLAAREPPPGQDAAARLPAASRSARHTEEAAPCPPRLNRRRPRSANSASSRRPPRRWRRSASSTRSRSRR